MPFTPDGWVDPPKPPPPPTRWQKRRRKMRWWWAENWPMAIMGAVVGAVLVTLAWQFWRAWPLTEAQWLGVAISFGIYMVFGYLGDIARHTQHTADKAGEVHRKLRDVQREIISLRDDVRKLGK